MGRNIFCIFVILAVCCIGISVGQYTNNGGDGGRRPPRPRPPQNNCDFGCAGNFEPVCGLFGNRARTFSNRCAYDLERCRQQGRGRFLFNGRCDD